MFTDMPSIAHEAPIELIRQHPWLAAELVQRVTDIPLPSDDKVRVTLGTVDASSVIPSEFRADITVVVSDKGTGDPLLLIIVESQGRSSSTKKFSWPAYLGNLREAHRCESAVLIVVCWDETEAGKCRRAIPMGHPGYTLVPIVIGPHSSPGLDGSSPWLTILAGAIGAIDMETDGGRRTVLEAIAATGVDTPGIRNLTTLILAAVSEAARERLEEMMKTSPFRSEFFEGILDEGIRQGIEKGIEQGKARGEAAALLKLLKARGVDLTEKQHDAVASSTDLQEIDRWFDRALTATSADDVFGQ